jgi:urease accessory protein
MPSPVRDVTRAYTVGVGGSTDSGKMLLLLALCRLLRDNYSIAVVTRSLAPGLDGSREYLIRHKALAPVRIASVDDERHIDPAIEWLMTEFRPELIFVEDGESVIDALADFTIHVVNGSGDRMSRNDAIGTASSDLLVLNKTHVGPPLDVQRNISVREALRLRGDGPCVFAQVRFGIGTIEIAKHFLAGWRQTKVPVVWAQAVGGPAVLTSA